MRRILLLAVFLPSLAWGQFWRPSAVNAAGVSSKTITAPAFCFDAACANGLILDPTGGVVVRGASATGNLLEVLSPLGNEGVWMFAQPTRAYTEIGTATHNISIAAWDANHLRISGASPSFPLQLQADLGVAIVDGSGVGTPIMSSVAAAATVDTASIPAQSCRDIAVTVTGAAAGAECSPGPPAALPAGLSASCYVSAAGTAQFRLCNVTAAAVDPASLTYRVRVWNP